ncbi:MAG: hypothetical protein ABI969_11365 [bacterium]
MRFHRLAVAFTGALAFSGSSIGLSAQTATQTVTFSVVSMSRAAISGPASPMTVKSPRAERAPTSASMSSTNYAITTNESNQKISASLDAPMPAGVSLAVKLTAPAGAASRGSTHLGTSGVDVVTGISAVSATALPILYTLNAKTDAAVAPASRMVTFTITAGQ